MNLPSSLEIGEKATAFEHEPYEATLKKCQRYYIRRNSNSAWTYFNAGHNSAETAARVYQDFPVEMNHEPVLETSAASTFIVYSIDSIALSDVPLINNANTWGTAITVPTGSGTLTAGRGSHLLANNSTSAYVAFESEI